MAPVALSISHNDSVDIIIGFYLTERRESKDEGESHLRTQWQLRKTLASWYPSDHRIVHCGLTLGRGRAVEL